MPILNKNPLGTPKVNSFRLMAYLKRDKIKCSHFPLHVIPEGHLCLT